jgi:hypothetical protein
MVPRHYIKCQKISFFSTQEFSFHKVENDKDMIGCDMETRLLHSTRPEEWAGKAVIFSSRILAFPYFLASFRR